MIKPELYDVIYLSPHLDDAVLSCGGQIFQRTQAGERVLIATIMAGDPPQTAVSDFAQSLHARWELHQDAAAARRAEDVAAAARVGADVQHAVIPDAIYRADAETGTPFYTSDVGLFGAVDARDAAALAAPLRRMLAALPPARQIAAPLAIGNHVDHQLVRQAAEAQWGESLWYYEDYPYAQIPGAREAVVDSQAAAWRFETIALTETAVQAKIEAIAAFESQVSTFFNDEADLARQIQAFTASVAGERLWQYTPPRGQPRFA